ncbi:hypothetical protein R6Q59_010043 [Mikania micrantha]
MDGEVEGERGLPKTANMALTRPTSIATPMFGHVPVLSSKSRKTELADHLGARMTQVMRMPEKARKCNTAKMPSYMGSFFPQMTLKSLRKIAEAKISSVVCHHVKIKSSWMMTTTPCKTVAMRKQSTVTILCQANMANQPER